MIITDPEKLKKVQKWPEFRNIHKLRYFSDTQIIPKFIKVFSQIATPLNNVLLKDKTSKLTQYREEAFTLIKLAFADTITLTYPDFTKLFIVDREQVTSG